MPAAMQSRAKESSAHKTDVKPGLSSDAKPEQPILFQTFFKSAGERTYAAQVKKAGTGNHFIVLTEGRRDKKTGEVRKTRVFIFGEDFEAFFKLMQETTGFIRKNPVPAEVTRRQESYWRKKHAENDKSPAATASAAR